MSGFETAARRSALTSLIQGLTLTDSGILGSPLSLATIVTGNRLDEEPPPGRALVYLQSLADSVAPDGLWAGLTQTWRILLYVPITSTATQASADVAREAVLAALHDSTLSGTAWTCTPTTSVQMNDGHVMVEVVAPITYSRAPGA